MPNTFSSTVSVNLALVICAIVRLLSTETMADEAADRSEPAASSPSASTAVVSPSQEEDAESYDVYRNLVYSEPQGHRLRADLYVPRGKGKFPGVVLIHGGGWRTGSKGHMVVHARRLAERGYVAMSINYRLAPRHKFPDQIHDCKAAVRWMRAHAEEYQVASERLAAYGYSAGGHLACLLGTTDHDDGFEGMEIPIGAHSTRVQAVVAGGAPCDFQTMPPDSGYLRYWLDGSRIEKPGVYRRASPIVWITADDPPAFFYSGQKDWIVPSFIPHRMHDRFLQLGVASEFFECEDKGHVSAFMNPEALERIDAFLDRVLKPDPEKRP